MRLKTGAAMLLLASCALRGGHPVPVQAHDRVTDDGAQDYPGLRVSVEDVGDAYHQARIVLTAGASRWRLLVERHAAIERLPGCLVVVDHWGSDVADCWVFVPATGRLWQLWAESGRFDHVHLHPGHRSDSDLYLSLAAHGDKQSYEGPVARFDLVTGAVTATHPEAAKVNAKACPAGDPQHR